MCYYTLSRIYGPALPYLTGQATYVYFILRKPSGEKKHENMQLIPKNQLNEILKEKALLSGYNDLDSSSLL